MSTLKVNTIEDTSGGATTLVSAQNTAKAWVNFQGTSTPVVNSGYNVTSITDNAVGDYSINFTNNMANANYAVAGTMGHNTESGSQTGIAGRSFQIRRWSSTSSFQLNYVRVATVDTSGNGMDFDRMLAVVYGD